MQGLLTGLCCSHTCHVLFVLLHVCSLDSASLMLALYSLSCCCLSNVCSLDSAALMLALYCLSCCCLSNVCSLDSAALMLVLYSLSYCCLDSAALLHAFCNLSLAFMTDFMLSGKVTRNHFIALAGKVCSICLLARNTCWQDLHTFSLIGTIALHCGQTLLGGMPNQLTK